MFKVNLGLTAFGSDKRLFIFTAISEFAHMDRQAIIFSAFCALMAGHMTLCAAPAQAGEDPQAPAAVRLDTPSGFPVPRFVSLKAEKTFCRIGPSFAHPVRITFMRKGLPVMVIAETNDHWRKIRDPEGDECWTHRSKLSGVETALVLEDGLQLRTRPTVSAPARARLGRGIIARIEGERSGWLRVSAEGVKGWAPQSGFWGARIPPNIAAPQN